MSRALTFLQKLLLISTVAALWSCREGEVTVVNTAPLATIMSPVNGESLYPGWITFRGKVEDLQEEDLANIRAAWSVEGETRQVSCETTPASNGDIECLLELEAGTYSARLQATDSEGLMSETSVSFTLFNDPPTAQILVAPITAAVGLSIHLEGQVSDSEEEILALVIEWTSSIQGSLGSSIPDSFGTVQLDTPPLQAGRHTLRLNVLDAGGASGWDEVFLDVIACNDIDLDGYTDCAEPGSQDCDDTNNTVYPGAAEKCDGLDHDCDGILLESIDQDADGYSECTDDCNDEDPEIYPDTDELCNQSDDNCNGQIDEGFDRDQDGITVCAESEPDCADTDSSIYPGAKESCNDLDDNCNGQIDEGFDQDGDTFTSCYYQTDDVDCDDQNSSVYPGAIEKCNAMDDNCDGGVDEGVGSDIDSDGFSTCFGDCDDLNEMINPNSQEICDGIDNNCDEMIDEGVTTRYYRDSDSDGFGTPESYAESCNQSIGYVSNADDCDDQNAQINPTVLETCDATDNNCNGISDEGVSQTYFADTDADSFGSTQAIESCSRPTGYVDNSQDCNDKNAEIYPGASETCDLADNNCDGAIDEGLPTQVYYPDADEDGFGSNSSSVQQCARPSGYITVSGDCNDNNSLIYPGAAEVCDSLDNDCDDGVDEGVTKTYFADQDGDGYGSMTQSIQACTTPYGYVTNSSDCDDNNANTRPGAPELCDAEDNDCDSLVDENLSTTVWYQDRDGDGYGLSSVTFISCGKPENYASLSGDCNDQDATIYPYAAEQCDGIDNNCDGRLDDGAAQTWYRDADSDTFGSDASTTLACSQPAGYSSSGGDCDDANSSIFPGASEKCNGADDSCDGRIDEGLAANLYYRDADGDGFGSATSTTQACAVPSGYTTNSGDCNDNNSGTYPGASEVCDAFDNDCDGQTDEGLLATYYRDADTDGYGSSVSLTQACSRPSGYVDNKLDCNDADAAVFPGAAEGTGDTNGNGSLDGDAKDNDCDGVIDEGTDRFDDDLDGYSENAGDCNDANQQLHPGASEGIDSNGDSVPDPDGIDNNCDGRVDEGTSSFDDDGDGFSENTGDCNDADATVSPAIIERFDGIDNNCDGVPESEVQLEGAFSLLGSRTYEAAGSALAGLRDTDGDGYDDLAVGAPHYNSDKGAVHLVYGRPSWNSNLSLATDAATLAEESSNAQAGFAVASAGDINNDGLGDLAVGAPFYDTGIETDAGITYVAFGSQTRWNDAVLDEVSDTTISGISSSVFVGYSLAGGGDINGDSLDDLLIGAPWPSGTGDGAGWVMVLAGRSSGWRSVVSMLDLCKISGKTGTSVKEAAGYSLALTGLTDGDDINDFVAGGQYDPSQRGDAWWIAGRSGFSDGSTYTYVDLPDYRYTGTTSGEFIGWSIAAAGDTNGDGFDDFLIGRQEDGNGSDAKAYLYLGQISMPSTGTAQATATTKFSGSSTDQCPYSVAGIGDIDHDGLADIAIGVANNTDQMSGGKIYLFYGRSAGFGSSLALSSADVVFWGERSSDQAGYAIAGAGDVNGDGFDDFAIGAPGNDDGGTNVGKVYLLTGFDRAE